MGDFTAGDEVSFRPQTGATRRGVVEGKAPVRGVIAVRLTGDPFAVCLPIKQLKKVKDSTDPTEGGETQMANKTKKSKKSKKSKTSETGGEASTNGIVNPYREGSSMAFLFDQLVKGGKVSDIAAKMVKKFPIKVRAASVDDEDAHALNEACYRTTDVLKAAEKAGFPTSKEGKGKEAVVRIG